MSVVEPAVGAKVSVPPGVGVVRFIGSTSFAAGKWVGIELEEPKGKNDGSVAGVQYFSCRMNYGVFVRPSQVKVLAPPPTPGATRPRLGHHRTSSQSISISRTPSIRAHPPSSVISSAASTSASVSSRAASPAKPLTSARVTPSLSRPSSKPHTPIPPTQTPSPVPPAIPAGSSSSSRLLARPERIDKPERLEKPEISLTTASPRRTSSPSALSATESVSSSALLPPPSPSSPLLPSPLDKDESPPSRPASSLSRLNRDQELTELRAKIRVLETKRTEDTRHVRELETRLSEAESFVAIRPKLQAKLQSLASELQTTKRSLADSQSLLTLTESRLTDSSDQLEMATLDKEMAEERAEAAESDVESLKERLESVEIELASLKEKINAAGGDGPERPEGGDDAGGGGGDDGPGSAAMGIKIVQLEKHNERLKEALIKVRDFSQQTEADQRRQIMELERELAGVDDLHAQYEMALTRLQSADEQIEELKEQLDDALGAEEMLVQLTERNLMLGEKIEDMRINIEELEALKELSDEIEEQHVETEKALQAEIDENELRTGEQARKIQELQDLILDYENTITQFRDLVTSLQSSLDALRHESATQQSSTLAAQSHLSSIHSANLKLQSIALKNRSKTLDLHLTRISLLEAQELLSIQDPLLPELWIKEDLECVKVYAWFGRVGRKAEVLGEVVGEVWGLPGILNLTGAGQSADAKGVSGVGGEVTEGVVGVCEMRTRISHLACQARRFAAVLRHCDVDAFLGMGRLLGDLVGIEKRIDMHIDLLRRNEFREMECVADVAKILAQFDHLSEAYFSGYEWDLGERAADIAQSIDYDLDMFSAAMLLTKTSLSAVLNDRDVVLQFGDMDPNEVVFEPLERLVENCRSVKNVARKIVTRIEGLLGESSAVKPDILPQLQALSNALSKALNFSIELAQKAGLYLNDVRASRHPFELSSITSLVAETAAATVAIDGATSWDAVQQLFADLLRECNACYPIMMEASNVIKIVGPAPWDMRVEEIKASLAINVDAEHKVAQLGEEVQQLVRGIKARDQSLQEAGVKIEHMERRMETVKKQSDTISELENEAAKARKQERAYEEALEQIQKDLDALDKENMKLRTAAAGQKRESTGPNAQEISAVTVETSLETSYLLEQLEALRGTVRFLRSENQFLKGQDFLQEIQALPPLRSSRRHPGRHGRPRKAPPTPPLDTDDTDDHEDEELKEEDETNPSIRELDTEAKLLYREVLQYSATPKVVDLSSPDVSMIDVSARTTRGWIPRKKMPAYQVQERKVQGQELGRRVQGLLERVNALGVPRR
ncbi:hypothetical protein SISNIDRAFT_434236 [Sistotremastrum niveocremeum HHB9708]|uniref:CAP-Gly domain-containing protein n=1 Tax=Sistotremastrum niveocremeum HHB9708 TaxID=1314777 RepID=A0A164MIP9_9AGAM|nr:hypothetical protein SISNIDRAFT_434236 [Sistotremastrum niveocremeum HHB9708]